MKFEVPTAVDVVITFFWFVTPCNLADTNVADEPVFIL
jgi:hypothetical protein